MTMIIGFHGVLAVVGRINFLCIIHGLYTWLINNGRIYLRYRSRVSGRFTRIELLAIKKEKVK